MRDMFLLPDGSTFSKAEPGVVSFVLLGDDGNKTTGRLTSGIELQVVSV